MTDRSHARESYGSHKSIGQPADITTPPVAQRRMKIRSKNQWSTEHQSHECFVARRVLSTSQGLLNVSVSNSP